MDEICVDNGHGGEICNDLPQPVTLTAAPATGFALSGWSGCTASGSTCAVTMSIDRTVTASFADIADPVVSLTSPSPGVESGTTSLAATANDNWRVDRVEFLVRGAVVGVDTSAPYSHSFATGSVADGSASVAARAVDEAGRTSTDSATITIDNTSPELSVSGPSDQTFGPGSTQTWTIDADDATTSVAVRCSVVPEGSGVSLEPCSGDPDSHSVADLPEGDFRLTVRAVDAAGNFVELSRHFTIDATPPETTIDSGPANGSATPATSATFAFSSSEAGSTFLCRTYQAALTPPQLAPCSQPTSHSVSGLSPGSYVFEVAATDAVGNPDPTPARRSFTVLPAAPPASNGNPDPSPPPSSLQAAPSFSVGKRWTVRRSATRVTRLVVKGLPAGATVVVRCRGKGCAFKSKRVRPRAGTAKLTPLFKGRSLRPGTLIEVRASAAGGAGQVYRFRTRKGKRPKTLPLRCLVPGSSRSQPCG